MIKYEFERMPRNWSHETGYDRFRVLRTILFNAEDRFKQVLGGDYMGKQLILAEIRAYSRSSTRE